MRILPVQLIKETEIEEPQ